MSQDSPPTNKVQNTGSADSEGDAHSSAEPTVTAGPNTAPDAAPLLPSRSGEHLPFASWDRYQIISFLGAGGMGSVYKARDIRLNRDVAIKFLRTHQLEADDTRQRRRFEREARAQASLDHPHICKIYEVGEVESQPYIAMELIQGTPLSKLEKVLTREQKLRVIEQVAEALHSAHQKGLIHRDIKPSSISPVENAV